MATKKPKKLLNTQELIERLGKHFPSPTYGFITQVRSATGSTSCRTADAMAMSLWPSRGLHILGFEVKASRNDWLNEIKYPSKAEEIARFCHEWYIVINDPEFIKEGELPTNWGLIVPSGTGMKTIKKAIYNQNVVLPDYQMLAGIFRNIAEQCIPKETLKTVLRAEFEKGENHADYHYRQLKTKHKELRDSLNQFEKLSGVKISSWKSENEKIGEAVKMVMEGKHLKSIDTVKKMRERALNLVKYLDDEVEHYKTL
jgi:hypothetical protein